MPSYLSRQDINNSYKDMGISKELAGRFMDRTKKHIQRVYKNAERIEEAFPGKFDGLLEQVYDHDQSKFSEPERLPYIWLTECYRCKENKIPFTYPEGMEDKTREVTLHHIRNNKHHPEYWDPNKDEIKLNKDRDSANQPQVTDATAMDNTSLAEQVADWMAMSQEKGTSLREWADKVINKRWNFTPEQVKLLYELVDFFEPAKDESGKGDEKIQDPYGFNNTYISTGYDAKSMVTKPSFEGIVTQDAEIVLEGEKYLLEKGDKIQLV